MSEPIRVDKFDWERLMLVSDLPWATRSILLALGVFMREDGSSARPGLDGLVQITRGRSVVIEHLKAAVDAGYLIVVERGGYRKGTNRATEYAAAVPAGVYERRFDLLGATPWRRAEESRRSGQSDIRDSGSAADEGPEDRTFAAPTSDGPDVDQGHEGPASRTFVTDERPVLHDQGPVLGHEGPASRTPTITYNNHLQQQEITTDTLFDDAEFAATAANSGAKTKATGAKRRQSNPKIDPNNPPGFDEWYRLYPRKDSPATARKAYVKALEKVDGPGVLLAAVKGYADEMRGTQKRFIKMPTTWLNGDCWLNESVARDGPAEGPTQAPGYDGRRVSTAEELNRWNAYAGKEAS